MYACSPSKKARLFIACEHILQAERFGMEIIKEILCPQCGEPQEYIIYSSINAKNNAALKNKILHENLFDWRCKRCSYFASMAYPSIYIDKDANYIICLTPTNSPESIEPTKNIQPMRKRMVKNLPELKEKLLIFDGGYDDTAIELVKNALCSIIKKTYKVNRLHAYFCRMNNQELEFALFLPGKKSAVYHSTKESVYTQSQEVLRTLDYHEAGDTFSRVDARLSVQLLRQYQEI